MNEKVRITKLRDREHYGRRVELGEALPEHTLDTLQNYEKIGCPTGGFLEAVISNDLAGAFSRADRQNRYRMFEIVTYIYNVMPAEAWGSPGAYRRWIDMGGLEGKRRLAATATATEEEG